MRLLPHLACLYFDEPPNAPEDRYARQQDREPGGGRTAQSGYGETTHKPCDLVTDAQVSLALGAKVNAGQPINTTGCQWTAPDDPKTKSGHVMITLSIWDEKMFPKGSSPGVSKKSVGGIGDDAVFQTLGDLTSLFVKKGSATLQLRVYGLHDMAKQEQIETSIAKDALANW